MPGRILSAFLFVILLSDLFVLAKPFSSAINARQFITRSAEAMGGLEKLRALKNLKFTASSHTNLLEQSERPEGPWIVSYSEITETHDLQNKRVKQTTSIVQSQQDMFGRGSTLIVADGIAAFEFNGQKYPAGKDQLVDVEERMAFGPESVLLTALDAKDLHLEKDASLQGTINYVLSFTWRKTSARLFINANTNLITAVELTRANPYNTFLNIWGDFTSRTYFSFWKLEAGGLHYPHQWDEERNNQPYRSLLIGDISFNTDLQADIFIIPDNIKQAFSARADSIVNDWPLGLSNQPARDIATNFILIPGLWYVSLVKQSDGIVIIETPISSSYSAKVIAEAEKRFPGVKIKAAISTSDAWPHLGGMREYVARGIPVYVLDVNQPIIKRLLDAPYKTFPDTLAQKPRKAQLRVVSSKTVIGSDDNRLELYPIRSETGERMIMIYAPAHNLLYGSDLVQKSGNSFFMPQYLWELSEAVKREKLLVDKVFAMHTLPLEWKEITSAIEKASAPK